MSIFEEWTRISTRELEDSLQRQYNGALTCLIHFTMATNKEYKQTHIKVLTTLLRKAHTTFDRFCNVCINLRRMNPVPSGGDKYLKSYQTLNLLAYEIMHLMHEFYMVKEYFMDDRIIMVIFLRITYILRIKLEKYLVDVRYWYK